jgi:RNA polymerase sigma-70 factor (ECF subfamily)
VANPLTLGLNSDGCRDGAASWEDDQLVHELREGSERAYEALVERFQQPVYNLIYRLSGDPADVNDVVQEVFLKIFRNIGSFRNQSSLKTWIYRIAVNEAHNYRRWFFRHKGRQVTLEEENDGQPGYGERLPDASPSPFDHVLDLEKFELIEEALARINPVFRTAVVLRDIEDLSYEQIAEILAISIGTVKSRILRGREAMRDQLANRLQTQPAMNWRPADQRLS